MAKKLLRNPAGKLLFEDPGDPLYLANGNGGGSFQCPECTAGCETNYYTTINLTSGTCNGNCTDIAGQTITQVGSTCQWTAVQGNWTHEMVCIGFSDGKWRYRVWDGGIGGTLCASWVQTAEQQLACPPLGSDIEGVWVRDGGSCFGDGLGVGKACPGTCGCDDPLTVLISGLNGTCDGGALCPCSEGNGTYVVSKSSSCVWEGSGGDVGYNSCRIECSGNIWKVLIGANADCNSQCAFNHVIFEAPNADNCPPSGGWVRNDSSLCSAGGSCSVS